MLKRILVLLLCLAILVSSVLFVGGEWKGFKDVPATHWAYKSIAKLVELGYMSGYSDGTFKPNRPVLRSEFVIIFVDAMNIHVKSVLSWLYEDVRSDHQAFKYAVSADRYFPGYYINKKYYFRPNNPVTREDVAAALVRYYNYDVNIGTRELDTIFSDAYLITGGLRGYVLQAYKNGIMSGSNGKFNPRQSMTRAEIAALFYKILEKEGRLNALSKQTAGGGAGTLKNEWYKDKNDIVSKYDPNKKIEITEEMAKNNLITNYSFENDNGIFYSLDSSKPEKCWIIVSEEYREGMAKLETNDKISGNRSAYFWGNLYYTPFALKSNTDYTLIGHMKRTGKYDLKASFSVSGSLKDLLRKEIKAGKLGEWEQFVVRFKTGAGSESAHIGFSASEFSYVDDIILVETRYINDKSVLPEAERDVKYGSVLIEPVEIKHIFLPEQLRIKRETLNVNDRISFVIPTLNVDGEIYYDMATLRDNALIEVRKNKHQYSFFSANGNIIIASTMSNEYIFNGKKYKTKYPVLTFTAEDYGNGLMIPETYLNQMAGEKFVKSINGNIKKCNFLLGKISVVDEVVEKWWVNDIFTVEYYGSMFNDDCIKYNIKPQKTVYWNIKGILYQNGGGSRENLNVGLFTDTFSNIWIKFVNNKFKEYILYTMIETEDEYGNKMSPIIFPHEQVGGTVYIDKEESIIYFYIDDVPN